MNIRCSFCQTPYTIGRVEKLDALQHLYANNLNHYDAHCPRCRRSTPVLRQKLEMTMPNWRDELKKFEAEMKEHPQAEAPLAKPEPAAVAEAESKPEPKPAPKAEKVAAKPAAKPVAKSAVKAAPEKKPAAKKPAAKKSK